jgi:general secretion pathway protein G
MKNRGFTLIEIIVAMAILSIMAGTLVPMLYKTWESNEIAVTRGRMLELKKAMVGDRALVQQGIRTHYGFVGDNGVLPAGILDLVSDIGTFANWKGPYLGGFDPGTYASDAWGNAIVYTILPPGGSVVAILNSPGPDGILGSGDEDSDLTLQILRGEVWPTATVQGNQSFTFTATTPVPITNYRANLRAEYRVANGMTEDNIGCIDLAAGSVDSGHPVTISRSFDINFSEPLPIGPVIFHNRLYQNDCTETNFINETKVSIFVSDGVSEIYLNPPTLYYPIN